MSTSLKVGLVVAAHSQASRFRDMIASAHASIEGSGVELLPFVHVTSQDEATRAAARDLWDVKQLWRSVIVPNSTGLATIWNNSIGVLYGPGVECDAVILANDDVTFGPGDLARLAEETANYLPVRVYGDDDIDTFGSDVHCVTCRGVQMRPEPPHGDTLHFGAIGITKAGWAELGAFDANFFPAYFEDCDWMYRAKLVGMREVSVGETGIVHYGSQTVHHSPALKEQNDRTFHANRSYYIRKWGGSNDHEVFTVPFNMGVHDAVIVRDMEKPWRIPPGKRFAPYGFPYDRPSADREALVKL